MRRLLLLSIFLLTLISHSAAQSDTLSLNTPIEGILDANTQTLLRFSAREGEVLSFIVEGSDSLDPILEILDLSQRTIIRVDDYDYPNNRNAILEAFTAPYTGNYDLQIAAYGNTSGEYTVTMQSGYASLIENTTFDSISDWDAVDLGADIEPEITTLNGELIVTQEGIDTSAHILGIDPTNDIYYVGIQVTEIRGAQGWRVGLVFNYADEHYHELLLNNNGSWRIARYVNNTETILRDWSSHPAIRAGTSTFNLSVLAHGTGYDFFYDNQYIGSIVDNSIDAGEVGLAIRTANAFGSSVTAHLDNFILTTPLTDNLVLPKQLVAGNTTYTVRELERRLVIPTGGALVLTLPESFAQNVAEGVSRFGIANAVRPKNFVLGATLSWDVVGGVQNACGLIIRDSGDNDTYWLAYVDSEGGYGTGSRESNNFTESYYNTSIPLEAPYQLLIVANEDQIYFYINGFLVQSTSYEARAGGIGQAIINFEANNTTCNYRNLWLWRFDE